MIPSDKALRLVHSPGAAERGRRPPPWQVDVVVRVADPVVAAALSTIARSAVGWTAATRTPASPAPSTKTPATRTPAARAAIDGTAAPTSAAPVPAASVSLDGAAAASGASRFTSLLITDTIPGPDRSHAWSGDAGRATVLVVGPTPYDARWALQAMATVPVHGMVLEQRPAELVEVLAALADDVVRVPASVVELARAAPALTGEQHTLAEQLVAGRSNPEICRVMGISQSGVKRRLTTLFELFEVDNRVQAAALAAALGIRPASR